MEKAVDHDPRRQITTAYSRAMTRVSAVAPSSSAAGRARPIRTNGDRDRGGPEQQERGLPAARAAAAGSPAPPRLRRDRMHPRRRHVVEPRRPAPEDRGDQVDRAIAVVPDAVATNHALVRRVAAAAHRRPDRQRSVRGAGMHKQSPDRARAHGRRGRSTPAFAGPVSGHDARTRP